MYSNSREAGSTGPLPNAAVATVVDDAAPYHTLHLHAAIAPHPPRPRVRAELQAAAGAPGPGRPVEKSTRSSASRCCGGGRR